MGQQQQTKILQLDAKTGHEPSVVVCAYNPSYSGGNDWEDCDLTQPRKKVQETPSQPIKTRSGGACLSSQLCRNYK
jgi:hypothetical protein